ncbi:heat-inducible transcriptional repressor HrcA [Acidithiobacillus marinus]|uniref:heat-inducible transcriptional repressor HrcA n=1 Tax=Acidithiobacillus marinus TaxID=187490 RepID=UPI0015528E6D|nr:heat-inducible transcriptional repressor HrcA [Acidithiobacillus marinus]
MALDERARHLLKSLIEQHIANGIPVGSRQLAKGAGLKISPATVRNVMADLEDEGYLISPHTSAGRIPTHVGYRFFVDALLRVVPLSPQSHHLLVQRIGHHIPDTEQVLHAATEVLSELTHMAGFVRVPRRANRTLRHVDFLALREKEVLAIFVTDKGDVENRLIRTEHALSAAELHQAANFFNESYGGRPLQEVIQQLQRDLQQSRHEMDRILRSAMELGEEMLEEDQQRMLIEGEFQLLDLPELAGSERLRELLNAVRQKRDLVHLLDGSMRGSEVRLFIGEESGFAPLSDCSVVSAPYEVDGEVLGVLGVIGPMRMPYQQIIPLVDGTAHLLGRALSQS